LAAGASGSIPANREAGATESARPANPGEKHAPATTAGPTNSITALGAGGAAEAAQAARTECCAATIATGASGCVAGVVGDHELQTEGLRLVGIATAEAACAAVTPEDSTAATIAAVTANGTATARRYRLLRDDA